MNIGAPLSLLFLTLLPVIWFAYLRSRDRSQSEQLALFQESTLKRLLGEREVTPVRPILLLLALLFAIVALARPQYGFEEIVQRREGLDVVFLVDVSKSMLAADLSPSRLERVRFLIHDLLKELKGDRVSLVTFAGVAFRETPLTYDYSSFRLFLDALSPELIPVAGTNLELALDEALSLFRLPDGTFPLGKEMVILLFSDGEEMSGDYRAAISRVNSAGAKVFTIGTGSTTGAPIPEKGSYKRDKQGKVVLTRLNEELLQEVAQATGGRYQSENLTGESFNRFFRTAIQEPLKATVAEGGIAKIWGEYFQIPLILSLACLLGARVRGILSLLLLFQLTLPNAASGVEPAEKLLQQGEFAEALKQFEDSGSSADRINYGRAVALYRQGKFSEAAKIFAEVADTPDSKLKAAALYNMGNSLTQMKLYQEAVEKFEQAKELLPNDREVVENLEYVRKLLPPESSGGGGDGSGGGGSDSEDETDSQSEQSQGGKDQQQEAPEQQTSEQRENSGSLKKMADAVEEDRGELARYRQAKALEDLKKAGQDLPEKDW